MFDDLSEDDFCRLLIECIDKRVGEGYLPQIREALRKRDGAISELRGEIDRLRGELRAMKAERRKAQALSAEAERCSLVRERAQAAEAQLGYGR